MQFANNQVWPPFVFVTVHTNVDYKVAAYFIVQSESTEQILEALNIFKQWNQDWKPAFFFVTILRLRYLPFSKPFPPPVYLCDFHE